jgi:hypothetical protein
MSGSVKVSTIIIHILQHDDAVTGSLP